LKKNCFGTCIIANVGHLGFQHAYIPIPRKISINNIIIAYTNAVLQVTFAAAMKKPLAIKDNLEIRDIINVTLSLDHRYTDGARATKIYQRFYHYLNDPEKSIAEDLKNTSQ